jgi:hypothetical protein
MRFNFCDDGKEVLQAQKRTMCLIFSKNHGKNLANRKKSDKNRQNPSDFAKTEMFNII